MPSRLHRIRLEAEGSSASAVENELALALARFAQATNLEWIADSQVIELNKNKRPTPAYPVDSNGIAHVHDPQEPWKDGWYFGRLAAFAWGNTTPPVVE